MNQLNKLNQINRINRINEINHPNAQNDLNETNQTNRKTRAGDARVIPIPKLPELRYTLGYLYERRDRSNPLVFPSKSLRSLIGKDDIRGKGSKDCSYGIGENTFGQIFHLAVQETWPALLNG